MTVALPILVPLLTAALGMLSFRSVRWQRAIGLAGAVALLAVDSYLFARVYAGGVQVLHAGNWPAPYGIVLVADMFSAVMGVLTGLIAVVVCVYSAVTIDKGRTRYGYYPMVHFLLMGVSGSFLTGDLFNLFVWFEVMLIASFVLMVMGGERPQIEGAVKYVMLNLVASVAFLSSLGILYGKLGTLNMADMAVKLRDAGDPGIVLPSAMLLAVAFGIKAGVFPLYFWLPASYHTPPIAVTTLFSALLTKVGVYALIRVFTLIFTMDQAFTQQVFMWVAGLTMVTGVLGAMVQYDVRRLLSFHIVSQIGYLIMGLAIQTPLAITASVYFMVHVVLAKSALFLIGGIAERTHCSFDLKRLGGLYESRPGLAMLFLVAALSLAGIPPLSGFFAKLLLIRAGLEDGHYAIVAVALAVSILTLYSMIKIWNEAFWKALPADAKRARRLRYQALTYAPVAVLCMLIVTLGILSESAYQIAAEAANQVLTSPDYIDAVQGPRP